MRNMLAFRSLRLSRLGGQRGTGGQRGAGVLVAPAEIRADGWTAITDQSGADWAPTTDPETHRYFLATQPGYDTSGAATTHLDRIVLTTRIRVPATATKVNVSALNDYVLQGALVAGAVNNSTLTGAKPRVRWALPDRRVIGNTLISEVVAVHYAARNGQPVAAVVFSATDGTNTVTQTVGNLTLSPKSRDGLAVPVYRCEMDITSLNDEADITLNATVYPWVGTAAAVYSSTEETDRWRFSPRKYRKSLVDFATPYIMVVKPSIGTATGVISRDPALARATPFATVSQALQRWVTLAMGNIDGAQIWINEAVTSTMNTGSGSQPAQRFAAVTVTRDPLVARADCAITGFGGTIYIGRSTTLYGLPAGCIELKDLQINSTTTAWTFAGELDYDDVTLTPAYSPNAALLSALGGFAARDVLYLGL